MMMMMTNTATTASAVITTSFGRKLMKGLQTGTRLPKKKKTNIQTSSRQSYSSSRKIAQNSSKLEWAEVICCAMKGYWLAWAVN